VHTLVISEKEEVCPRGLRIARIRCCIIEIEIRTRNDNNRKARRVSNYALNVQQYNATAAAAATTTTITAATVAAK